MLKPRQSPVGLCSQCSYRKIITSARGSQFILCTRSHKDKRFAKYPALPVIACHGFKEILAPEIPDKKKTSE